MNSNTLIDYEGMALKAMRSVVRAALEQTAEAGGLPGDHHFYISFDTQLPGVSLSKRLQARYPQEMTIVLQHRFWDLVVKQDYFEVKLTFDSIPERLVIPFEAIKMFFDPSVRYGLQFEAADTEGPTLEEAMASLEDDVRDQTAAPEPTKLPTANWSEEGSDTLTDAERNSDEIGSDEASDGEAPAIARPRNKLKSTKKSFENESEDCPSNSEEQIPLEELPDDTKSGSAEIVSLDAFRKK